jgi:hypothetical protein
MSQDEIVDKPENFPTIMHKCYDKLDQLSYRMFSLAKPLSIIGLDKLSVELFSVSQDIEAVRQQITDAVNADQNKQYQQAMQSSLNVFNAATAGIALASVKNKKDNKNLKK